MITVYIASPYTKGDVAENVRYSLQVANTIMEWGAIPFAPLLSHFWHLMFPHPYEFWMKMDFEWIKRCNCLLRLPGESKGADMEVEFAKENGIPVYYSMKELRDEIP
jgi:hypothetical protein